MMVKSTINTHKICVSLSKIKTQIGYSDKF